MTPASPLTIKDYLLGKLSAEQETELEELYFSDTECVAQIWAVFADLSEQYLNGELSEIERALFEQRLRNSPVLREMFENERALWHNAPAPTAVAAQPQFAPQPEARSHSHGLGWLSKFQLRFALLSAGVLLTAGIWFFWHSQTTTPLAPEPIATVQDNQQNNAHHNLATPLPQPSVTATPETTKSVTTVATFFLPTQLRRGTVEAPTISLSPQIQTVRLELQLIDADSATYSAVLSSDSAEVVQTWKALTPQHGQNQSKVVLRIPARALANADYLLEIKPLTGSDRESFSQQFRFTVAKQ